MFLRAEPTEKAAEKVLKEFCYEEGLKEVVGGILDLQRSKFMKRLFLAEAMILV
ncbi:MAG: hypothetical protein QMD61_02145 [Methanobacterium sp.]|nr:hypothetical protein [Methanobacterium sp.]